MNVAQKLTSGLVATAAIMGMFITFNQIAAASPNTKSPTYSINLSDASPDKITSWMNSQDIKVSISKTIKNSGSYNIQLRNATAEEAVTIFADMLGEPVTKIGLLYYIGDKPNGPLKSGGHMEPAAIPPISYTL